MSEPFEVRVFEPPPRADICRFHLSRPILPGSAAGFASAEQAAGEPFLASLFEVPEVTGVAAEHALLVVSKADRTAPWAPVVAAVRERVEAYFASGAAPSVERIAEGDAAAEEEIRRRVQALLDESVNPGVAAHGGAIRLEGVSGSRVFVRLEGGCQGCGASSLTVKQGLASAMNRAVPEVTEIVDVTDHAAGQRPYFQESPGAGASALT